MSPANIDGDLATGLLVFFLVLLSSTQLLPIGNLKRTVGRDVGPHFAIFALDSDDSSTDIDSR